MTSEVDPSDSAKRPTGAPSTALINFSWLVKLRWAAVAGQLATTFMAMAVWRLELPLGPLLTVIGVTFLSNVLFALWTQHGELIGEWTSAILMAFDVVLLTALLHLAGGSANPFSTLYFVHIALGALVLRAGWLWLIVVLSFVCYSLLFVTAPFDTADAAGLAALLKEMVEAKWLAFGLAAGVSAYFVSRIRQALAAREEELERTREREARSEKLASLATLSAGAAHELSTPLSTIAVAAKELERQIQKLDIPGGLLEDTRLIREQVDRCRAILTQMAADAGHSLGELAEELPVKRLVELCLTGLAGSERVTVTPSPGLEDRIISVPPGATAQALRGIVKNGLDASPPDRPVVLGLAERRAGIAIVVKDRGQGMPKEVLARIGEPFFTTKEPGRGMGLGIFLARAVAERVGGELSIHSEANEGTTAELYIPVDSPRQGPARVFGVPALARSKK